VRNKNGKLRRKKNSDLKICLKEEVASQRASEGANEQATGSEREREQKRSRRHNRGKTFEGAKLVLWVQ
jgi:hypothetical protein